MDIEGNRRLDWFFNEYVYGTQLPSYKFTSSFETAAEGTVLLSFNLTQSNVDEKFAMLVPIYIKIDPDKILLFGRSRMVGNTTQAQKVPIRGIIAVPRRAMINYYDDVLASAN